MENRKKGLNFENIVTPESCNMRPECVSLDEVFRPLFYSVIMILSPESLIIVGGSLDILLRGRNIETRIRIIKPIIFNGYKRENLQKCPIIPKFLINLSIGPALFTQT